MQALYNVQDPRDKAMAAMSQAANTYSKRMPEIDGPGKTAMGGVQNVAGGALAGKAIGTSLGSAIGTGATAGSTGGVYGMAAGAIIGLASYYMN